MSVMYKFEIDIFTILPTLRYGLKVVKIVFALTFVDDSCIIDVEAKAVECILSVNDLKSGEADEMDVFAAFARVDEAGETVIEEFTSTEDVANTEVVVFIKVVTVAEDGGVVKVAVAAIEDAWFTEEVDVIKDVAFAGKLVVIEDITFTEDAAVMEDVANTGEVAVIEAVAFSGKVVAIDDRAFSGKDAIEDVLFVGKVVVIEDVSFAEKVVVIEDVAFAE